MIRSSFRKANPLIVAAGVAGIYFFAFTAIDLYILRKPVNYGLRISIAIVFGILYFMFQSFVNKKIETVERESRLFHKKVGNLKDDDHPEDEIEKVEQSRVP